MNENETTEPIKKKPGRPPKVKLPEYSPPTLEEALSVPSQPVEAPAVHPVVLPFIPPPMVSTAFAMPVIEKHAVVQVTNPTDPAFGVLFQVGDTKEDTIHGFFVIPGEAKQYVTTKTENVKLVGKAFVGSHSPCSDAWVQSGKPS